MKTAWMKKLAAGALWVLLLSWAGASVFGQAPPVIASFSQNGALICTNLEPGSVAVVEWASSVDGPWTTTWAGLDAVTVDSNGRIEVNVPMFYRVRGNPAGSASAGMALIPAGSFMMGDTFSDSPEDRGERPVHTVDVSAFYMDRYEVTKALWDEVHAWGLSNGYTDLPAGGAKGANHPVHSVIWYDVVKWCNARSEKEGLTPAYYTSAAQTTVYRTGEVDAQNDWVNWDTGYRLPTEAEWEKAARGGSSGRRFPWGDTDEITHSRANYWSASSYAYDTSSTRGFHPTFANGDIPFTSPAGYFQPNGYGLHDMAGNVREWCWDWWDGSYYGASVGTDPRGPSTSGSLRAARGGSWDYDAFNCRSAVRKPISPLHWGDYSLGFRCARASGQ